MIAAVVTSDANASDRLTFGVNSSNRARIGSYPDIGLTLQIQMNVLGSSALTIFTLMKKSCIFYG